MTEEVKVEWDRALQRLETADSCLKRDPESSANRSFYAAFHAVSALFALEGRTFASHREVAAAVHRDLVKTGRWPVELGAGYSQLLGARDAADYGGLSRVDPAGAEEALKIAKMIVDGVRKIASEPLP